MMLLQPQEVEVYYILPAIRSELARALKELGRTQVAIASLLGVSGASVTHYLNGDRGAQAQMPIEMRALAREAAARITDRESMIRETQGILAQARETKMICRLHERIAAGIPKGCCACYEKEVAR